MTTVATSLPRRIVGERVRRVVRLTGFMQKEVGMMVGLSEARMSQKITGVRSGFEWAHLYAIAAVCAGHDALKHVSADDLLGYLTGGLSEIPGFRPAPWRVGVAA